jgi:hypothetical protein
VRVWEQGESQSPLDRALTLLAAAWPERTREELASLSIAERDAMLWSLRELTFGPQLNGFTECPQCRQRLEFTLDNVLGAQASPPACFRNETFIEAQQAGTPALPGEYELEAEGLTMRFRLPNSHDLAMVATCEDPEAARDLLARRCVLEVSRDDATISSDDLTAEMIARLTDRMAECAPQAEALMDFNCPACGHCWQGLFDIVMFFWTELAAQAKRLLREVDALARAYGWREAEILALSPRRRQAYLEMVS